LNFHGILYQRLKDHTIDWATGPSSFVVLGLLEADGFSKKESLMKSLRSQKKILAKAATEQTAEQSEREKSEKGSKKGKKGSREAGNKGTRLLLEKLG